MLGGDRLYLPSQCTLDGGLLRSEFPSEYGLIVQRPANYDVSRQFVSPVEKIAAQLTFGFLCEAAMAGARAMFDSWARVLGPFALIYPTVLLVMLYGHWRAGMGRGNASRLPRTERLPH